MALLKRLVTKGISTLLRFYFCRKLEKGIEKGKSKIKLNIRILFYCLILGNY